jgi:hypothetical protein
MITFKSEFCNLREHRELIKTKLAFLSPSAQRLQIQKSDLLRPS